MYTPESARETFVAQKAKAYTFKFDPSEIYDGVKDPYMYWDEATQQYGFVLTKIAGEPLHELLKRRILVSIGISRIGWDKDTTGKVPNWTGGIRISASDLARFGHLFLNQGNWNGRQLINADWVREAK